MGERLTINLCNEGKKICNIYYHWGGYTDSNLYYVNELLKCHKKMAEKYPDKSEPFLTWITVKNLTEKLDFAVAEITCEYVDKEILHTEFTPWYKETRRLFDGGLHQGENTLMWTEHETSIHWDKRIIEFENLCESKDDYKDDEPLYHEIITGIVENEGCKIGNVEDMKTVSFDDFPRFKRTVNNSDIIRCQEKLYIEYA